LEKITKRVNIIKAFVNANSFLSKVDDIARKNLLI